MIFYLARKTTSAALFSTKTKLLHFVKCNVDETIIILSKCCHFTKQIKKVKNNFCVCQQRKHHHLVENGQANFILNSFKTSS